MKAIVLILSISAGFFLFSCSNQSKSSTEQSVKLYLIALEGSSQQGRTIGCNDILVEITKTVKLEKTPLESTINELIAAKDSEELKNFVKGYQLMVIQLTIANSVADVYLNGELSINGTCDIPRIREQLNETAKQFTELKKVNFYINSQPIENYLNIAGQGF
ncbi:MAG: GerMN domain-containing protein [Bacteroidota bacterium]